MEAFFRDVYATLVQHVKKLIAQQFSQYPLLQSRVTYVPSFLSDLGLSQCTLLCQLTQNSLYPVDQSRLISSPIPPMKPTSASNGF